jgi:hypothetical protein
MSKNLTDPESPVCHRSDVIEKHLTLQRKNICLLTFILQGYEGFATATTIDKRRALVKLFITADLLPEIEGLLNSLKADLEAEEVFL